MPALPATLDQFPELLSDLRVEKVWDRLRQEMKLPDGVDFATYEQPPQTVPQRTSGGLVVPVEQPAQAVFLVVSPNPHPRHKGRLIKSFAFVELSEWLKKEAEAWRFVGVPDASYAIFKELCRQHLASRKNFEELI
jgi:hypothetical protein